jgi:hypothetical protein
MAVWALRVGYLGLVVVMAGLIGLAFGSTPWSFPNLWTRAAILSRGFAAPALQGHRVVAPPVRHMRGFTVA